MSEKDDNDSHDEVPHYDTSLTTASSASDDADEEFGPFAEIHDRFDQEPAAMVMGADGMPMTAPKDNQPGAPPLSVDTLLCMRDTSKFVRRNPLGYIVAQWEPRYVTRHPNGTWTARTDDAEIVEGVLPNREDGIQPVEPVRPQCRHYVRQAMDFELNTDHRIFYRLCSARRTTEGTFMTVRDTGVYACEMRDPRDVAKDEILDQFDAEKINAGAARTFYDMRTGKQVDPAKKEDQ